MRVKNMSQYSIEGKRRPPISYIFIGNGMISYTWKEVIEGVPHKIAAIFCSENDARGWLFSKDGEVTQCGFVKEVKHICKSIYGIPVLDHFTRLPVIDLYTGKPNSAITDNIDSAKDMSKIAELRTMYRKITKRIKQIKFNLKYPTDDLNKEDLRNELSILERELNNGKSEVTQIQMERAVKFIDRDINVKQRVKPKAWEEMTHRERVESKLLPGEEYDPDIDG